MAKQQKPLGSKGSIIGVIGLLLVVALMYVVLSTVIGAGIWIWKMLFWITPVFVLLGMLFDSKTILSYGSKIVNRFKSGNRRDLLMGLASVIGFPFVAPFLFSQALSARKIRSEQKKKVKNKKDDEDYVEYEPVEEEDDFLELEDLNQPEEKPVEKPLNRYDDLFE